MIVTLTVNSYCLIENAFGINHMWLDEKKVPKTRSFYVVTM